MAAMWPVVQARLVTLIPTIGAFSGVTVYDGPPAADSAQSWISVGHVSSDTGAGTFEQRVGNVDALREEDGTVLCEVVVWSGDDDLPARRTAAFVLTDALDATIRADQTLGVLRQGSTVTLSADVVSARDPSGSTQRLLLSVNYTCRA